LLHGKEELVFGDAGYQGVEKRDTQKNVKARWHVAMRPGKRRALPNNLMGRILDELEQLKASVRAKVEHPFHIIKNLFGLRKVRNRGLAKNTARLYTLFGLANLVIGGESSVQRMPELRLDFSRRGEMPRQSLNCDQFRLGNGRSLTKSERRAPRMSNSFSCVLRN
jgi:hypothetical protein